MTGTQVRAQYTRKYKLEAVRQVQAGQAGQAISVVAKVLGIPKASLGNWVRQAGKGDLEGAGDGHCRADGTGPPAGRERAPEDGARHRKKGRGVLRTGHAARYAWIHQMRKHNPVSLACEVLDVRASGYFSGLCRRPVVSLIFHSDRSIPVMQPRVPGCFAELGDALIDKQEGPLLTSFAISWRNPGAYGGLVWGISDTPFQLESVREMESTSGPTSSGQRAFGLTVPLYVAISSGYGRGGSPTRLA